MAAITIANIMQHAISFLKATSTYASAEEVRFANTIQSLISSYHRWNWTITAGTNIAVSAGTQTYTMAAGDQNKVQAINEANLLSSTTELPNLIVQSDPVVPRMDTQNRPWAVSLISPTQIRLYPNADATYTFQWRYHARPVIFAANTESFQLPEAYIETAKAGMIWMLLSYADDTRSQEWQKNFYDMLVNHKHVETLTVGRNKI